jgi:transposase
MERLSALLHAKFELREKPLAMIYDVKNGKKYFFLETDIVDGVFIEGARPLLVEPMTDADRQQELLESESKFEVQEDIALFNAAEGDQAILTVGRYNDMWYSALRVKVGAKTIVQRLDSEQPSSKKRSDQINRACATFVEWVDKNFDRESAKGFKNAVELVKTEHAERAE